MVTLVMDGYGFDGLFRGWCGEEMGKNRERDSERVEHAGISLRWCGIVFVCSVMFVMSRQL